jgi:SAM-dependent methyltransferase
VTRPPVLDPPAARALGAALRRSGYTEDAVHELLGEDAYAAGDRLVPVHARRLPQTRLGAVVRALFLALPVAPRELGEGIAEPLAKLGLAVGSRALEPRARLLPVDDLLIASDALSRGVDDPPDYVATYTPTARTCAALTPRRHVGRALDVGTGNGVQALLAAAHADRVVATDVNPRALAFTALNAALNEIDNVETRAGSLFEPVAGETFDLITCNAPFVISPENRFTYRDGAFPADELSERVVTGAERHLAEDGRATLLASWASRDEAGADERPFEWIDGSGCDAWVLAFSRSDPLEHAAGWNDYLEDDPERYGAALDEWTSHFAAQGIGYITEGAVLLHRRRGRRHTVRTEVADEETLEPAGEQIERVFRGLARQPRRSLAGAALADAVRFERELDAHGNVLEVRLRLEEGTHPELVLTPAEAEQVMALADGPGSRDLLDDLLLSGFIELPDP